MRQTHRFVLLLLIALGTWSDALVETVVGQTAAPSETPRPEVALLKVYPPVYPPLARQARIMGDVRIQLEIRQDGRVASAEVVCGHPMLKQAALESAQKSTFWCQSCRDTVTVFTLTYTFGTRYDLDGLDCGSSTRLRAAECLYLWRCGRWQSPATRKPAVGYSSDHVMILADPVCVETETVR